MRWKVIRMNLKKSQIIELFGLPGSGKSTLARALQVQMPSLQTPPEKKHIGYIVLCFLRYPLRMVAWAVLICVRALPLMRQRVFWYSLSMLAKTCSDMGYAVSRKGIILLEEGFTQRLLSVATKPSSPLITKVTVWGCIPKPNRLFVTQYKQELFKRYSASHPRRVNNESGFEEWKQTVTTQCLQILKEMNTGSWPITLIEADTDIAALASKLKDV